MTEKAMNAGQVREIAREELARLLREQPQVDASRERSLLDDSFMSVEAHRNALKAQVAELQAQIKEGVTGARALMAAEVKQCRRAEAAEAQVRELGAYADQLGAAVMRINYMPINLGTQSSLIQAIKDAAAIVKKGPDGIVLESGDKFSKIPLGLYRIYWKDDPSRPSLAAVGMRDDGSRWLAPTNWVAPSTNPDIWADVVRVELIAKRGPIEAPISEPQKEPDGWTGSWCPQCGPNVKVDEDGCCVTCGCTAVGDGVEQAQKLLETTRTFLILLEGLDRLKDSPAAWGTRDKLVLMVGELGGTDGTS